MKTRLSSVWIFLSFWGMITIVSAAFSPEEAGNIFTSNPIPSSSNYREVGDYVFMEIKWQDLKTSEEEKDEIELNAILEALEKYICVTQYDVTKSPFCPALTTWLIPEIEYNFSDIESVTLKEEDINGEHRLVMAFDAIPLRKSKENAAQALAALNGRTETDWAKALSQAYTNFRTKEEKRKFFQMLGCPIVLFLDESIGLDMKELATRKDKGSAELLQLLNWKPAQDSIFSQNPSLTWGFYKHSDSALFFPRWNDDDGGAFEEAKKLYLKGKDIPKILTLLTKSISMNPIGSTKWEYLGGTLKASGKYQDAVIAYMQSILQKQENKNAWKWLAKSMEKAGFSENANGLTWYLRMKDVK